MRINVSDLERQVDELNELYENNSFQLSGAYGGYQLHQKVESGGCRTLLSAGHVPKRELYGLMRAYIDGIRATLTPPENQH